MLKIIKWVFKYLVIYIADLKTHFKQGQGKKTTTKMHTHLQLNQVNFTLSFWLCKSGLFGTIYYIPLKQTKELGFHF